MKDRGQHKDDPVITVGFISEPAPAISSEPANPFPQLRVSAASLSEKRSDADEDERRVVKAILRRDNQVLLWSGGAAE